AVGSGPGQCPFFPTVPSFRRSRSSMRPLLRTVPLAIASVHEGGGLSEAPDAVRYRRGFLREPAVKIQPLPRERSERLPTETQQLPILLAWHPRLLGEEHKSPEPRRTAVDSWALGLRVLDDRARDRRDPTTGLYIGESSCRMMALLWARLLPVS